MDEQLLQNLRDSIQKSEKIVVLVGKNPTVDSMAASLSFSLILQALGKTPQIVCQTEPTVEVGSLVGIDRVLTQPTSQEGDLIVSFPYKDGEIENVSYTMEDNFLNIVVKAGENGISFNENDVKFTRGTGAVQLLFTIGVTQNDDMYAVIPADSLTDATIVNIDNHDTNERYGDINLVSGRFSSLSEQLADLILTLGYEEYIDQDTAQNLLSGIIDGTNNFQNSNTSFLAFEMTAELMKKGATRDVVRTRPEAEQDFMSMMQQPAQIQNQNQPKQQKPNQNQRQQQPKQNQPAKQGQNQPVQTQSAQPQPQFEDPFADLTFPQEEVSQAQAEPQAKPSQNPPSDWLTPKVYKGSTNV